MKKIISIILLILPFLLVAFYWNSLPERIPMHWNFEGEVDRYSDSKMGILALPFINIAVFLLFTFLPKIDPKRNFGQFMNTYKIIMNLIMVFLVVIFMAMLFFSLGYIANQTLIIQACILILFTLLGNYFGKIKANYFVGIRTPWTLENEEVWRKTHRMSGLLWVISSLLMLTFIFVSQSLVSMLFIPYVVIITVIPVVYSYLIFRKITVKAP